MRTHLGSASFLQELLKTGEIRTEPPQSPAWAGSSRSVGRHKHPCARDGSTSQREDFVWPCPLVMIISALPSFGQKEKLVKVPALKSRHQSESHHCTGVTPARVSSPQGVFQLCLLAAFFLAFFLWLSTHFGEKNGCESFFMRSFHCKKCFF